MSCKYEVRIGGQIVWSDEVDAYQGDKHFPEEYRRRPESGAVELIVDGEIIGVQTPEAN